MDTTSPSRAPLDKLLPKALSEKRRRRKEKKLEGRGSPASREIGEDDDSGRGRSRSPATSGRALSSLGSDDGEGASSSRSRTSITKQSLRSSVSREQQRSGDASGDDHDDFAANRPAVSTHPSLIGYLTTASPVVQAEHLDTQQQPDLQSFSDILSNSSATIADDKPEHPVLQPPGPAKIAHANRRPRPSIETKTGPPKTPPSLENSDPPPAIVSTPPTPTESQTARSFASDWKAPLKSPTSSTNGSSPTHVMSGSHRRSRTSSVNLGPSKLSTITSVPHSPLVEGNESSSQSQAGSSGFFSSMLTAAQTAATNISTNIQNSGIAIGPAKNKNQPAVRSQSSLTESTVSTVENPEYTAMARPESNSSAKEAAFHNIGTGDLSLSHLGLTDPNGSSDKLPAAASAPDLTDNRARSESAPADHSQAASSVDLTTDIPAPQSRPRSLYEPGAPLPHEVSFSSHEIGDDKSAVKRNSSLRSASRGHRKRGSSVATAGTGATIGAAIAATHSSLGPAASAPKLTGFAIATKKRNRDFHNIFKSVPDDDYLIEDYSCALQREILAHGRLYVSEGHLCFSSNILGWTTTLVISFDEIVSVEKRSTALVFKNGLMVSTLHAKHIFASFTSRDATYDLIVNIWKLGHPTLTSTLNGVRVEGSGSDKTEKADNGNAIGNDSNESQAYSDSEEDNEDDEDSDDDSDDSSEIEASEPNRDVKLTDSTISAGVPEKSVSRKVSASASTPGGMASGQVKDTAGASEGDSGFPGPATHPPTDCGDVASHYDKIVGDEIIQAPLGQVYNLLFGPGSVKFMSNFLSVEQKCTDLSMDDKKGLSQDNLNRTYSYIKPLFGSIGPKQTKCIVSETLENLDLEKSANLLCSTQTPDVPNGNMFTIKTRYCLSWAENNATRLQMNCTVEWSAKSWLKGPIEKGATEGQTTFCKDVCASLRGTISSKAKSAAANGTGKIRKRGKRSKMAQAAAGAPASRPPPKQATQPNWGVFEPIRSLLEPLLDIFGPLITGNLMYGLLVGLLVATWFSSRFAPGGDRSASNYPQLGPYSADRFAAHEEMWRREDSELWEWLEERVGVTRLGVNQDGGARTSSAPYLGKRPVEARTLEEKIREEKMGDRQVQEAIRVTEEKLAVLRQMMDRASEDRKEKASQKDEDATPKEL